jgi:CheY-like chemotaxis protein
MTGQAVLVAVDDLFFLAKIGAVAKQIGVELVEARSPRALEDHLASSVPRLVILDLNSASLAPLEVIRRVKSDSRLAPTRIVAFLSHVQVELEQAARAAGCDVVLPRSRFSADLAGILTPASEPAGS